MPTSDTLLVSNEGGLEEIHLRDYISVLRRRAGLIFCIAVLIFLGGAVFTGMQSPVLQATASLEIQDGKSSSLNLEEMFDFGGMGGGKTDEMLGTETAIIKSRPVMTRAVELSGLQLMLDRSRPLGLHVADRIVELGRRVLAAAGGGDDADGQAAAGFSSPLPEPAPLDVELEQIASLRENMSFVMTVSPDGGFTVADEDGRTLTSGQIGRTVSTPLFTFRVIGTAPEATVTYPLVARTMDSALKFLSANLSVSPTRNTRLLNLSVQTVLPGEAEPLLTSVIQAYQEQKIRQKTQTATKALRFLEDQIGLSETQMSSALDKLKEFKEKNPLVSLPENVQQNVGQLASLEQTRNQLQRQERQARYLLNNLTSNGVDSESLFALGSALNRGGIVELGTSLNSLQIERVAALSQFTERHPRIVALDKQIGQIKTKIRSELSAVVSSLAKEQGSIQEEIRSLEGELGTLPRAEQELVEIRRQARVYEDTYSFLLGKKGELQITKAGESGSMWIVDPAHTQSEFVKPKLKLNLLLSIIVGLTLGVGLAFFLEYMDDTIKTPKDLENLVRAPLLGNIGQFPPAGLSGDGPKTGLHVLDEPTSQVSEGYRTLRSNLLFTGIDSPKKTFLITSALPGAGKSTTAANLAVSIAQTGKRVLLVDTDLRKPTMHTNMRISRTPGLVNALLEKDPLAAVAEIIRSAPQQDNLFLLPCGDIPPNPSELLSSEKMRGIIKGLRDQYDYVLFDTPPMMATSDSMVLGAHLDGLIYVVRSGMTRKGALEETLKVMAPLSDKMTGLVLNGVDFERERYYYYYYGYYANSYYSYGAEESGGEKKKKRKHRENPARA